MMRPVLARIEVGLVVEHVHTCAYQTRPLVADGHKAGQKPWAQHLFWASDGVIVPDRTYTGPIWDLGMRYG